MSDPTYASVLQRATELTGRVYPPSTEEAGIFRGFLAQNLRFNWESFPWPEDMQVTQEFFAPDYSAATAYVTGDVVYFPATLKNYQALTSTTGNDPATLSGTTYSLNSAYWVEALPAQSVDGDWDSTSTYAVGDIVTYLVDQQVYACIVAPSAGVVPTNTTYFGLVEPFYSQVNKQTDASGATRAVEIGEVSNVYRSDPRKSYNQRPIRYEFNSSGVLVRESVPFVWVYYRTVPPALSSDPSTFPYRFAEACALQAAGQMLRVDGKVDMGNELLLMGREALNRECDKVTAQEAFIQGVTVMGQ